MSLVGINGSTGSNYLSRRKKIMGHFPLIYFSILLHIQFSLPMELSVFFSSIMFQMLQSFSFQILLLYIFLFKMYTGHFTYNFCREKMFLLVKCLLYFCFSSILVYLDSIIISYFLF